MSSVKFKHSSGNSMAIAAPASNPASNLEMKLPSTLGAAGNVIANGTTPGTLEFVSGVRAWVTFEGNSGSGDNVSVTISDSRNVSSVTRVSDSRFQINFSNNMGNANYSWTAVARRDNNIANSFDVVSWWPNDDKTSSSFRLRTFYISGSGSVGSHNGRVVQVIVVS